jgi:hypothetical protein
MPPLGMLCILGFLPLSIREVPHYSAIGETSCPSHYLRVLALVYKWINRRSHVPGSHRLRFNAVFARGTCF